MRHGLAQLRSQKRHPIARVTSIAPIRRHDARETCQTSRKRQWETTPVKRRMPTQQGKRTKIGVCK
eukprot:CAMPEP_0176331048 /NCGR_PEP_ID=MMETSP0121_2-20121125/76343_1 /TAXON_ID=160619 /ORGANISM="Kryptoperidinium foliaceum, Strain CCMP 1326" /LENGTH=65 /DNA_ID=CAMNT_0017673869 /DNA_START=24 /DNA_END=219 /DNA_ORIENTATION=+